MPPIFLNRRRAYRTIYKRPLLERPDKTDRRKRPRKIFRDEKTQTIDGFNYVYVPHNDTMAFNYFCDVAARRLEFKMKVVRLPEKITPEYVESLNDRPGILSLTARQKTRRQNRRRAVCRSWREIQ